MLRVRTFKSGINNGDKKQMIGALMVVWRFSESDADFRSRLLKVVHREHVFAARVFVLATSVAVLFVLSVSGALPSVEQNIRDKLKE